MLNTNNEAQLNCFLCNEPVDLHTAKTDANGKAVHAECYTMKMITTVPATPTNQQPAS